MEPDDTCIRRDIERLNLASSSTSHGMSHIGYTADRWDVNRRPIKPRARSEYSHLDKVYNYSMFKNITHELSDHPI